MRRTENLANKSGTIKALSLNHSRRSAVEGPLSKERRSSEARRRRASLLVYNMYIKWVYNNEDSLASQTMFCIIYYTVKSGVLKQHTETTRRVL